VITQLESEGFPVAVVCQTLGVSRAGYYAHAREGASPREQEDARLRPLVRQIFWEHKRRYGARRIAAELAARGETCGPGRASRLLKQLGLQAIQPRSFRPRTTQSRHPLGYSPNLLLDAKPPSGINQVWLADITFVPLASSRFAYLALLMDLYSRRIVGWELDEHMTEALVLAALREAVRWRQPSPGLIHHSDRGGQYAGSEYRQVLRRARMEQSMSRPDNCYDSAFLESCFGKLKTELEMEVYPDVRAAKEEIGQYLCYYVTKRRHSSLNYLTPCEFELSQEGKGSSTTFHKTPYTSGQHPFG
jgi:putative transposase